MRVAVITGGRDVTPSRAQIDRAFAAFAVAGIDVVRVGMARGVDMALWRALGSRTIGPRREAWPADWQRANGSTDRGAGLRRNDGMLSGDASATTAAARAETLTAGEPASLLVAWSGGDGTADCIVAAIGRRIVIEPIDRDAAEILVRIVAPSFVAGAIVRGDAVVRAAPILLAAMRRAGLRGRDGLRALVRAQRWRAEIVAPIGRSESRER